MAVVIQESSLPLPSFTIEQRSGPKIFAESVERHQGFVQKGAWLSTCGCSYPYLQYAGDGRHGSPLASG